MKRTLTHHYHAGLRTYLTSYQAEERPSFAKSLLPFAIVGALLAIACGPYLSRQLFGV